MQFFVKIPDLQRLKAEDVQRGEGTVHGEGAATQQLEQLQEKVLVMNIAVVVHIQLRHQARALAQLHARAYTHTHMIHSKNH